MLICDDPKFVFVSTPRSGTHAMYRFLGDRYGVKLADPSNFHPLVVPGDKAGHFIFTTVRNPYRRAISAWWMLTQRPEYWDYWRVKLGNVNGFVNYLRWIEKAKPGVPGKGAGAMWPQVYWLRNVRLNATLHLEHVEEEFAALPFVGEPVTIPRLDVWYHVTTGVYGDWRPYYQSESIELVQRIYANDFEKYGYSTDIEDAGDA